MQLLAIGQALGIQPARPAPPAPGTAAPPNAEIQAFLGALPVAPMPRILTPAEYLRQRAGQV